MKCRPARPIEGYLVTARGKSMRERGCAVKTESLEGHEATKALVLAVAGLMIIMLVPNLVVLLLY